MLVKGTQEYEDAAKLANELQKIASYERFNNNTLYKLYVDPFLSFIDKIKDLNVFASQIANTIYDGFKLNGYKISNLSSKQAWILACAAIENNIVVKYIND